MSIYLSIYLHSLSIYLPTLPIYLSTYTPYLSIYLPTVSIYLSTYLSIYLSGCLTQAQKGVSINIGYPWVPQDRWMNYSHGKFL